MTVPDLFLTICLQMIDNKKLKIKRDRGPPLVRVHFEPNARHVEAFEVIDKHFLALLR